MPLMRRAINFQRMCGAVDFDAAYETVVVVTSGENRLSKLRNSFIGKGMAEYRMELLCPYSCRAITFFMVLCIISIFCNIASVFGLSSAAVLEHQTNFKALTDSSGNKICTNDIPSERISHARSSINCAALCEVRTECIGFNYWEESRLCEIFHSEPSNFSTSVRCSFYKLGEIRFLLLGNW